jgi:putative endonuclease
MFFVYVLKSTSFGRYYVGSTGDVEKRLALHNGGHAKWTKRFQPWELVHQEEFATRGEAVRRERALKAMKNIERYLERVAKTSS